jgi:hypothetical protein
MTEENSRRIALGMRREGRWNELNKIYRAYIPPAPPRGLRHRHQPEGAVLRVAKGSVPDVA